MGEYEASMKITIACDFVDFLEEIGVDTAFGVSGGYIVPMWQALSKSKIINFKLSLIYTSTLFFYY